MSNSSYDSLYELDIEGTPKFKPHWYVVIEVAYLVLFVVTAYSIRILNFMKTDDDAVTAHHSYHAFRIKKQEEELIAMQKQQENFLKASGN